MTTILFCDVCGAVLSTPQRPCPACGHVQQARAQEPVVGQAAHIDEMKPGSWLAQRYRIQKKIGEGGFGLVYVAWDKQSRRSVAIKQITLASLSAQQMIEATDSYNREITILPRLQHRSLPGVYDHFTDPGHWYIVMQYIEGLTLEELLAKNPQKRLPVGEVIAIGAMLCDVLGYLHVQEPPVVFRDVKPANIMYSKGEGRVYLIDFGIARRYREGQSKDTGPLGSPGYAAPEQYGKAQSTPRTDVYGLGVTLQTLLTGKEPWEIQADGLPPDCVIPVELQTLMTRMTEPDPEQRPALMWSIGQSLRELQKRYPRLLGSPRPLAWLEALWILLMLVVAPVFFPNIIHRFLLIGAVCVAILRMAYQFYKTRRGTAGKLSDKDIRAIAQSGLAVSFSWIWMFWTCGTTFAFRVITTYFDAITFIELLIYVIVSVAGMLLIRGMWRRLPKRLLKRVQKKQTALPDQQSIQVSQIEQRNS